MYHPLGDSTPDHQRNEKGRVPPRPHLANPTNLTDPRTFRPLHFMNGFSISTGQCTISSVSTGLGRVFQTDQREEKPRGKVAFRKHTTGLIQRGALNDALAQKEKNKDECKKKRGHALCTDDCTFFLVSFPVILSTVSFASPKTPVCCFFH